MTELRDYYFTNDQIELIHMLVKDKARNSDQDWINELVNNIEAQIVNHFPF